MIALAVFTDGRDDLLAETLSAAESHLVGLDGPRFIFDDSGHNDTRVHDLRALGGARYRVVQWPRRLGFAGTIASAWKVLAKLPIRFIFHLEDDFLIRRRIDLRELAKLLDHEPGIAQVALRRQAIHPAEVAAGGVVEGWPDEYVEHVDPAWLEHRLYFTTNPCLYRASLCALGWPETPRSEDAMRDRLLGDGMRFALWGSRHGGANAVEHIGVARSRGGTGY